jgi:hypothetical protein
MVVEPTHPQCRLPGPKIEFAIDALAALGQITAQGRRLFYFFGHLLCDPDDNLKFALQGSFKSFCEDAFFRVTTCDHAS